MAQVVEITEAAAFHVKEMMRHNGEEGSFLRVAVNGGGCSGLTYGMGFEEKSQRKIICYLSTVFKFLFRKKMREFLKVHKLIIKSPLWGADLR